MHLTEQEQQLIVTTFAHITTVPDETAEIFYQHLFEIDPTTKPLFAKTNMQLQGQKLMQTLAVVVGSIHRLDAIEADLQDLGKRHTVYRVTKKQYDSVGKALIVTLSQQLGEQFTPDVEMAWTKVYSYLAQVATSMAYDESE